jgi:glycosyltransferase involved in cell wall biosynthesis
MDLIEAGPGGRAQLGAAARRRVEKYYNLLDIVERYESLYSKQLAIKSC